MGQIKAKTLLQKLSFSDNDKKDSQHDVIQTWAYKNIEKIIAETIMKNNPHPYEIKDVRWEHQVMYINGNYRSLVGFIDLMVHIDGEFYYNDTKKYENGSAEIFIEIKTKIPVLGELIRQMRSYQAFKQMHRTYYLIISPDDRFNEILNEQGFYSYKYKDPTLLF